MCVALCDESADLPFQLVELFALGRAGGRELPSVMRVEWAWRAMP